MARPLSFRWNEEFVARIDAARGDVPRSAFVRRAVERELSSNEPRYAPPGKYWDGDKLKSAGTMPMSRAVERTLSEAKEPRSARQADPGSVPSSEGVRSAASAEQSRAEMFRRITQR